MFDYPALTIQNFEEFQNRENGQRPGLNAGENQEEMKMSEAEREEQELQNEVRSTPLLNHISDIYDTRSHVRVRLLSSRALPIKFEDCAQTSVEQDTSSKGVSNAFKSFEKAKSNMQSVFNFLSTSKSQIQNLIN